MTVKDRILQAMRESQEPAFTNDDAITLEAAINAPVKNVALSTLGGVGRESLMISISLEPKSEWNNGIFQNSNYLIMAIHSKDGKITLVTHGIRGAQNKKFRKQPYKGIKDAANKINNYLSRVKL